MKTRVCLMSAAVAALSLLLSGCPQTGVVCQPGTDRCGDGCADFSADRRNCGACGNACQSGQVCNAGSCECEAPATTCGGKCVSTNTDPLNCGGCGNLQASYICAAGQLCEATANDAGVVAGRCKGACENPGATVCGSSCVDLSSDTSHCGSCGTVCVDGRSCKAGVCSYDVVLACRAFGQIRGVRVTDAGIFQGPLSSLGTTPAALGVYKDVLLAADDTDRKLIQASLSTFAELLTADGGSTRVDLAAVPGHLNVTAPLVLITNSAANTLQIVRISDAGTRHPHGLSLATINEVQFGTHTSPQWSQLVGQTAYVPLYGGGPFTGGSPDAGQAVARVNLADPANPSITDRLSVEGLVTSFDGGTAIPRPYAATSFDGKVYVALNNLDSNYAPAGEGTLAQIDPANGNLAAIKLGGQRCLNASYFAQTADTLYVSCAGQASYDSNFVLVGLEKTSVLALKKNTTGVLEVVAEWSPCPSGTSCGPPAGVGRIAVVGNYLFAADQTTGRIWVLSRANNALTEVTNLTTALAAACPPPSGTVSYSSVYDMVVVP